MQALFTAGSISAKDEPPLLTHVISPQFTHLGTEWHGNTPLLREMMSSIWATHRLGSEHASRIAMCFESEHSLVLPGGRDLPANTPAGRVASIANANEFYTVRPADCDVNLYDIVVQYSMTNVKNYELSGLFSNHILGKIIYVPPIEYNYAPYHTLRDMTPLTTFIRPSEPRRSAFASLMSDSGIPTRNVNHVSNRRDMRALYDRSAILLNIHQTPHHHTLEEFRILPALLRGVVVVSEVSPLTEFVPFRQFIIWSTFEDFPSTVAAVIKDYDVHHHRIFGNRSAFADVLRRMKDKSFRALEAKILNIVS